MPEARDSVLLSDVQRIEANTPFIKEAYDETSLTPEQQKLEILLSGITKNDIEFIQTREANLGKGSYGEVQLARHKATGIQIAVKKIEKASLTSSKIKETLIREIRIQKQLNHEYICRLYTSFEDKTTIYLALEYASKGNLFYLIRKEKFLSEDTAFYFFIQVCSGIYYLHKQGLIHRDIKPENILIKEGNIVKICDFGWCVQTDHMQQRNTFCGTLEYMAPEMIQNKHHNHTLDIWSLGILLYELVHGRAPFTGVHPREISDKIMRGQIRYKPGLSIEYKDLVNKILVYETKERLPLIKVFDHPWVKNFEKKYNLSKQPPPKKEKAQDKSLKQQILKQDQQQDIQYQNNQVNKQIFAQKQPKIDEKKAQQNFPQNRDVQNRNIQQSNSTNNQQTNNQNTSINSSSTKSHNPPEQVNNSAPKQGTKDIRNQSLLFSQNPSSFITNDEKTSEKSHQKGAPLKRTSNSEDIMKELEDYVYEKKQANKYLDDISEFETMSNTKAKVDQHQRLSKKQKDNNNQVFVNGTENNMNVNDYCDKMMKDLSHLDKQLENRSSAKSHLNLQSGTPGGLAPSGAERDSFGNTFGAVQSTSKQNANQILNSYLNQASQKYQNESHSEQILQQNSLNDSHGKVNTSSLSLQSKQLGNNQNKQGKNLKQGIKQQILNKNIQQNSQSADLYVSNQIRQQDKVLKSKEKDPIKSQGTQKQMEIRQLQAQQMQMRKSNNYMRQNGGQSNRGSLHNPVGTQQNQETEEDSSSQCHESMEDESSDSKEQTQEAASDNHCDDWYDENKKDKKQDSYDEESDSDQELYDRRQEEQKLKNKQKSGEPIKENDPAKKKTKGNVDTESEEEEEPPTFFQRLGNFFFMGCSGSGKR